MPKLILLISNDYSALTYPLIITLLLLTLVFFFIALFYRKRLKTIKKQGTNTNSEQLNSLLNSLNDIIFEFNEDKVCLNVWFNNALPRVVDPNQAIGKKLSDVIGPEKAKKFNDALDHVIKYREATSLEYLSDFDTGEWFLAKMTPVFDHEGNYTSHISASLTNISKQKKYAGVLNENELLLNEAQTIAKAANWCYDNDTKEIYWSKNLYSILEIDPQLEPGNKFESYMKMVHPDDRENLLKYFSSFPENMEDIQYVHKLITPKGNLKYLKVSKATSLNKPGNNRIFGVTQDITESKLSEKAIKVSRAELIEAQTIAKIGNWKWDAATKKIQWSDEITNICEIDQLDGGELGVIKLLLKYIDKRDKFILQHFLKSVTNVNNYSFVFRIITPQGKIKYLSVIVGRLITREDGTPRKIIGTLQDITTRKEAEIAHKRTENKYKLVLETIKLAALSLDNNGNIIFCNQYLANLLGYEPKEILGAKWIDFIPEDSRQIISGWFENNTVEAQYIIPVICRNGEQRIISWQNTISYDENALIKENTSIGEDITDQQKVTQELISAKELAEKASEFKSEFLSIMSHEIRTPMNAVIGITNLLMSEEPKPEQLEYLNILKFSAENLLAIINDILDYNKIEAGKLELNTSKFNLYHLTQKIKKSFYLKATEKLLDIEVIIDEAVPEYVMGDQMRLSQILNNLVSNALKFTNRGKITIQLVAEQLDNIKSTVKFTIADTGIGIASENLRLIFDPFMQESQYINSNSGGTGLGLAITKRLIELHQSNIYVLSELGKGTQFTFSIAFELPKASSLVYLPIDEKITLNLYGMNLLIVDDNKMNLLIAAKFLKKWQANVDEASNGQIAVDMVKAKTYDLIIMDLQMPVMDGFEATKAIKAIYPQLPVIALTANAMPETYTKALNAGMSDYLTKPFVPSTFFEKIAPFYKVDKLV